MDTNTDKSLTASIAHEEREQAIMGFWIYLLSDTLIFGTLFAAFFALKDATAGGPNARELFDTALVLKETLILLASSYAASFVLVAARHGSPRRAVIGMLAALTTGSAFLFYEFAEFVKLIGDGAGPSHSAFLSSYFALLGTHGLHVFFGSIWLIVLLIQTKLFGITSVIFRRLWLFSLFWHFLDIVWILIFTFVYLFAFI